MTDQAENLRRLAKQAAFGETEPTTLENVIVFIGANRGLGVTTLATNTAIALARHGVKVVLAESNFANPRIADECRIRTPSPLGWLVSGKRQPREVLQTGPCGLAVLGGRSETFDQTLQPSDLTEPLTNAFSSLGKSSTVIVDAGCELNEYTTHLCQRSESLVVVTSEEDQAILSSYALIKRLANLGTKTRIGTMVNQASSEERAENVHARISASCNQFLNLHTEARGSILKDESIGRSERAGRPLMTFAPQSSTAFQFNLIARTMLPRQLAASNDHELEHQVTGRKTIPMRRPA